MKPHERALMATLLDDYSETLSNRGCNDWDWPEAWTTEQRQQFLVDWHANTGSADEDLAEDLRALRAPMDWMVADLLAHKLRAGLGEQRDDPGFETAPARYTATGREAIDVIRDELGDAACRAFCVGTARKYELRAGHKPGADNDPEKARWYRMFAAFLDGLGPDPRDYRSTT